MLNSLRLRATVDMAAPAIRVVASVSVVLLGLTACGDGDSPPTEPNSRPAGQINSPETESRIFEGQLVQLEGEAQDAEDGTLPDSSLVWHSHRDGILGSGATLTLSGLSLGFHDVALVATDSDGAADTAQMTLVIDPIPQPAYQIEVRFVGSTEFTADEKDLFHQAARRWEEVIIGDVSDLIVQRREPFTCDRVEVQELDQLVDDLVVFVELAPLDGPNDWIGWGAPCVLRDNYLPAVSNVVIDIDDRSSLDYVLALHEFAHAIGFGEVWDELGLLKNASHPDHGNPILQATQDASLSSSSPDQNLGFPDGSLASENLAVGVDLGVWTQGPDDGLYMSLIQFDLSGVGTEWPITDARLILSQSAVSGPPEGEWRLLQIRRVEGVWSEGDVTWNNRPVTATEAEDHVYSTNCDPSCSFNHVTSAVRSWLAGDAPNAGLAVESSAASETPDFTVGFHSRHSVDVDKRPRLYVEPDTYFAGPSAIAAFDSIGGAVYTGAKVPVENDYWQHGESADGHWRGGMFMTEIMSAAWIWSTISSVTVGALEDMGYAVDHGAADPFTPSIEAARPNTRLELTR